MMNLALQEIALKLNELKQLNFEDINKKYLRMICKKN